MHKHGKESVFKAEYRALQLAEQVLKQEALSQEQLLEGYRTLLGCYRQLLEHMERIARISDLNQRKLFNSHEAAKSRAELLYRAATTDELTEIYNRSYLIDFLDGAFFRAQRYQQGVSCVLIDIDDFKQINDTYGHLAGDEVLAQLAALVNLRIRHGDVFGRLGGEEFLIVLPHTTGGQALALSNEIRASIEEARFDLGEQVVGVTVSSGVAEYDGAQLETVRELVHRADLALYQAKAEGKNRSVLYRTEAAPSAEGDGE